MRRGFGSGAGSGHIGQASANFPLTSNAAASGNTITGVTVALAPGKSYRVTGKVYAQFGAGGVKLLLGNNVGGSGMRVDGSFVAYVWGSSPGYSFSFDTIAGTGTTFTMLNQAGGTLTDALVEVDVIVVVTAPTTMELRMSQNSSNVAATTALRGACIQAVEVQA